MLFVISQMFLNNLLNICSPIVNFEGLYLQMNGYEIMLPSIWFPEPLKVRILQIKYGTTINQF